MDLKKSTMAERSLKEYPQWGQQRRLQFFEKRQPAHFTSPSTNSFPQRGHFKIDFILVPVQNLRNPNVKFQMSNQCQMT